MHGVSFVASATNTLPRTALPFAYAAGYCAIQEITMAFMAARQLFCVDPSAGFHGSPAGGFFKPVVKMDADLFVTIACEAILGYQKTNVSGEEAAELFEELKAELDDSSERSFVD